MILGGCQVPEPVETASSPASPGRPLNSPRESQRLKDEDRALKSRAVILAARLAEQLEREKRLSVEVNKLRFLTARQEEQIRALAGAPAERDAYREKCQKLTIELARLRKQIAKLQGIIAGLRGGRPTPGTNPAGSPGT